MLKDIKLNYYYIPLFLSPFLQRVKRTFCLCLCVCVYMCLCMCVCVVYVCVCCVCCVCVRARARVRVYVCVCLQNVFHTLAMFRLFNFFIQLWPGRKTAIMAIPVPQFPLLLLIFYYFMYYM